MKGKLSILLPILLCVLLLGSAATSAPLAEIWIASRTDGVRGTGSVDDPFDGSTATLFDQTMRGVGPRTIVHIGPGLFRTTGSFSYNEKQGFYLPVGCKIVGAGMDATTVRGISYPVAAGVNGHSILESQSNVDGAGIQVTDLTIDCNWQNLGGPSAARTGAVNLHGNNCSIRRVRAINAYGNWASLAEAFVLSVSNYYSGSEWKSVSGALIENCEAESFLGDYGCAISLIGAGDNGAAITGVIQHCQVFDWNGTCAYQTVGCDGVGIIANQTYNCKSSVYFDTGHLNQLEISGNHFYGIRVRGIQCSPSLGAALIENLFIHDNFFEVSDAETPTPVAIGVSANSPGHEKQIRITYNTVTKKLTGTHNAIAGIGTAYCDDLFVAHNWVDSVFQNPTYVNGPYFNTSFTMAGNVDELGRRPAGMKDMAAEDNGSPGPVEANSTLGGDVFYLADFGVNALLRYDQAGNPSLFSGASVNGPNGVVLDSGGNLYVSTGGNTIEKFGPSGNDLGLFASTGLNLPMALTFDRSGNLYAANFAGNTVEKFDANGKDLGVFANVVRPTGLAFDAAGDLYVSNFGNTIARFSASGASQGNFAVSGLNNPEGLAFDSLGNLYAANSGSNTIEEFSPSGADLGAFASAGLSGPIGLVFDSAGNLYASNSQTSTIEKFTPGGDGSVFAATDFSPAFLAVQPAPTLVNISTRLKVLTGENVLDAGFIVRGAGTKSVLIRGLGPSLGSAGVPGALADPVLELHSATGAVITTNDDWKQTQQSAIEATGIPPAADAESAIVATLSEGSYTVIERGKNDSTGVGLVEIYDLTSGFGPELANISTRGFVDTGSNVMIAGFIVSGRMGGSSSVIVRALGPSLGNAGVADPLADPTLELYDGNGSQIAANDDWKSAQQAAIEATGVPPTDDAESAIVATLPAGAYTAIERGKNDSTGVGLVEVYNLE